jgi:hypothetical protein
VENNIKGKYMIWENGLTWEGEKVKKEKWHKWFAWYPVIIGKTEDEHHIKAWLQYIERQGKYACCYDGGFWIWNYRKGE